MQTRRLGTSDLYVSEIGFGCMSLGTEKDRALRMLHTAQDNGVNFFDTADLYDQGRNEELVGEAFAGRRSEVLIATKVGNRFEPDVQGWTWDPSPTYIRSAVEHSLRRLRTDYIDLYQLHGGTMADPFEDIVDTLEDLQTRGYIRAYGISSIRPNVILRYLNASNISSVMMQYSLLDRRPAEWFGDIAAHGVSVIARGPLARGLLSGPDRRKQMAADETYLDKTAAEVAIVQSALDDLTTPERSASQVSMQYALYPEVVATAIPGASTSAQLLENISAASAARLTGADIDALNAQSSASQYVQHRP